MLTLVFGAPGTGKTTLLWERIAEDLAQGRPAFLIVPEHTTVSVEATAARRLPPSAPLLFEVTNFTRLCDTYFRRFGGVSERAADDETALLVLRDTVASLSPLLHDRRRVDTARILEVRLALRELSAAGVTPDLLKEAAEGITEDTALSRRLDDLALILAAFEGALAAHGSRPAGSELVRLAEILRKTPPSAETSFYLDGFTSFTAVQLGVLATILGKAPVTVTLPMPERNTADCLAYAEIERTLRDLRRLASERGVTVETVSLTDNRRTHAPVLNEIGARLFTPRPAPLPPPSEEEQEALRFFECRTPFSEAELVAADIARRIRLGASYRDFAIVARSAESYRGILDAALERHGIPAFFSLPTDLSAFEITKLIKTAYAVVTGGGRREDVITYAKCGLAGIPDDDCDRLELYAERWELSGRRLLYAPYKLPPGGYATPRTEAERAAAACELAALEDTRRRLVAPLEALKGFCKGEFTIKEHCAALYDFLSRLDVDRLLFLKAHRFAAAGDAARADIYSRLFREVTETLDRLVELIPESRLTAEDFSELLTLLFSSRSLGSIPPRGDAVTVGSADLLRPNEPRHIYLIGVNADSFPRTKEAVGIFSAAEILLLGEHGIVLDGDEVVRISREWFCFLRAFLSSSETVTLTYTLADAAYAPAGRSEVLDRILAMTGERFPIRREEELPPFDLIFSREAALTALGKPLSPKERASLLAALATDKTLKERLALAHAPLVDPHARCSPAAMQRLLGNTVSLTQSRIDAYVSCPFSYFCRHMLSLGEDRRATLGSADIGNYVHALMEQLFTEGMPEDDEAIAARVAALTEAYLATLFPRGAEIPARVRHRFLRLSRLVVRLATELAEELKTTEFSPLFFEYEPSATDEDKAAPPVFTLEDGTRVVLYGKIDRVDIYRKDGNVYLRVLDYKTGKKLFSLENVARGRDLQLLLYLFALWKCDKPRFLESLGVGEGKEVLPAGALYLNLSLATPSVFPTDSKDKERCARSGLLLSDEDSLHAMDPHREGRFIPIKYNKDGSVSKLSLKNLQTLEELGEVMGLVSDAVKTTAKRLIDGVADATPLLLGNGHVACSNCAYYPVCRNVGGGRAAEG